MCGVELLKVSRDRMARKNLKYLPLYGSKLAKLRLDTIKPFGWRELNAEKTKVVLVS